MYTVFYEMYNFGVDDGQSFTKQRKHKSSQYRILFLKYWETHKKFLDKNCSK